MTSHNDTWESLKAGYISQVEKALSGVSHPRKKEVLADVQSHLEQRFAELGPDEKMRQSFEVIIAEMGPASDYAELLEPDAKPRRKLMPWLVLAGVISALLVVTAINAPKHAKYGPKLRELFNCNYSANPFFSMAGFEQIESEMTENQVRDLIGYPMERYQISADPETSPEQIAAWKDKIYWDYTGFAFDGAKFFQSCSIIFSKNTGKVLKKRQARATSYYSSTADPAYVLLPKKVGDLKVMTLDGKKHQLSKADTGISIIVFGGYSSLGEITSGSVKRYEKQAIALLDAVGAEGVKVYYFSRKQRMNILVYNLGNRRFDFDYLIYKEGKIYAMPVTYASFEERVNEGFRQDKRWLIRKLME